MRYNTLLVSIKNNIEVENLGSGVCEKSGGRVHVRIAKVDGEIIKGCCKSTSGRCSLLRCQICPSGALSLESFDSRIRGDAD